jgi:hypothetical protein
MKLRAILIVFLAFALAWFVGEVGRAQVPSSHLIETGNEFLDQCQTVENLQSLQSAVGKAKDTAEEISLMGNASFCLGYTTAVVQMGILEKRICYGPRTVPLEQHVAIVRRYLAAHPERRDRPAVNLALLALSEAFPCTN